VTVDHAADQFSEPDVPRVGIRTSVAETVHEAGMFALCRKPPPRLPRVIDGRFLAVDGAVRVTGDRPCGS